MMLQWREHNSSTSWPLPAVRGGLLGSAGSGVRLRGCWVSRQLVPVHLLPPSSLWPAMAIPPTSTPALPPATECQGKRPNSAISKISVHSSATIKKIPDQVTESFIIVTRTQATKGCFETDETMFVSLVYLSVYISGWIQGEAWLQGAYIQPYWGGRWFSC